MGIFSRCAGHHQGTPSSKAEEDEEGLPQKGKPLDDEAFEGEENSVQKKQEAQNGNKDQTTLAVKKDQTPLTIFGVEIAVYTLGMAFFFMFLAYTPVQSLLAVAFPEIGKLCLLAMYAAFLVGFFVSPIVIENVGTGYALLIGPLGYYAMFLTAALGAAPGFMILGSALAGFFGAIFWSAQYVFIIDHSAKNTRGRSAGVGFAMFSAGGVAGGLLLGKHSEGGHEGAEKTTEDSNKDNIFFIFLMISLAAQVVVLFVFCVWPPKSKEEQWGLDMLDPEDAETDSSITPVRRTSSRVSVLSDEPSMLEIVGVTLKGIASPGVRYIGPYYLVMAGAMMAWALGLYGIVIGDKRIIGYFVLIQEGTCFFLAHPLGMWFDWLKNKKIMGYFGLLCGLTVCMLTYLVLLGDVEPATAEYIHYAIAFFYGLGWSGTDAAGLHYWGSQFMEDDASIAMGVRKVIEMMGTLTFVGLSLLPGLDLSREQKPECTSEELECKQQHEYVNSVKAVSGAVEMTSILLALVLLAGIAFWLWPGLPEEEESVKEEPERDTDHAERQKDEPKRPKTSQCSRRDPARLQARPSHTRACTNLSSRHE